MPITVHAYTETEQITPEKAQQLINIYDTSPEFGDGEVALKAIKVALINGDVLYTAEFNEKIIGAIWSRKTGNARTLQYIVTHPANRGRGIAETLIADVYKQQQQQGITEFIAGCGAVHRILDKIQGN